MDKGHIQARHQTFDECSHSHDGVEFWYARDLQVQLGYARWENFVTAIERAKVSCSTFNQEVNDHFRGITKMVDLGSGAQRSTEDYMLTRYACYLIAQNGDVRKPEIAFAQAYFAMQTRKQELLEERLHQLERVEARQKLAETEKILSGVLYEHGVDDKGFAFVRSAGDAALFGIATKGMKKRLGVPDTRPLADFLPTVTLKAKEFAAALTGFNVQKDNLSGVPQVTQEHAKNNKAVRQAMLARGVQPENLPPEEDIKKVSTRLKGETKALISETHTLPKDKDQE